MAEDECDFFGDPEPKDGHKVRNTIVGGALATLVILGATGALLKGRIESFLSGSKIPDVTPIPDPTSTPVARALIEMVKSPTPDIATKVSEGLSIQTATAPAIATAPEATATALATATAPEATATALATATAPEATATTAPEATATTAPEATATPVILENEVDDSGIIWDTDIQKVLSPDGKLNHLAVILNPADKGNSVIELTPRVLIISPTNRSSDSGACDSNGEQACPVGLYHYLVRNNEGEWEVWTQEMDPDFNVVPGKLIQDLGVKGDINFRWERLPEGKNDLKAAIMYDATSTGSSQIVVFHPDNANALDLETRCRLEYSSAHLGDPDTYKLDRNGGNRIEIGPNLYLRMVDGILQYEDEGGIIFPFPETYKDEQMNVCSDSLPIIATCNTAGLFENKVTFFIVTSEDDEDKEPDPNCVTPPSEIN